MTGILFFRLGPQDLPGTPVTLGIILLFYMTVAGLSIFGGRTPPNPGLILALYAVLPALLIWAVLRLGGRPVRFIQTASALYGTGALLSILNLPLVLSADSEPPAAAALVGLVVFFWHLAVDGHIWRHALEVSYAAGLVVAVILFGISFMVVINVGGIT